MISDILRPGEFVGLKQAEHSLGLKGRTLRRWYRDDPRIGRQSIAGGRIELSLPATLMYRVGNIQALDLYSAGERSHDLVQPFIDAVLANIGH